MKRLGLAAVTAAVMMAALGGTAAADGTYYGTGFGGGARLDGQIADRYDSRDHVAGRIVIGRRIGSLALEGAFFGTDLTSRATGGGLSTLSLGVDLKYYAPITSNLELYIKGGVDETWLATTSDAGTDYSGRGYSYGAGAQYAWRPLPILQMAVWIDLNRQIVDLASESAAKNDRFDGRLDMVTVGFSIGTEL